MDCTVHGVAKSWMQLRNFHFTPFSHCQVVLVVKDPPTNAGDIRDGGLIPGSGRSPKEGSATHTSVLAWRIAWTREA